MSLELYLEAAVTAPCPKSIYKDNRHSWGNVMFEEGLLGRYATGRGAYYLKRCSACGLSVLAVHPPNGSCDYDKAPLTADTIIHVFYHKE